MIATREALQVLDQEFLETRSKILELAASLDRLDRAPGHLPEGHEPRLARIRQALEVLLRPGPDRAETVQLLFSDPYDPGWLRESDMPAPSTA